MKRYFTSVSCFSTDNSRLGSVLSIFPANFDFLKGVKCVNTSKLFVVIQILKNIKKVLCVEKNLSLFSFFLTKIEMLASNSVIIITLQFIRKIIVTI